MGVLSLVILSVIMLTPGKRTHRVREGREGIGREGKVEKERENLNAGG